MAYANDLVHHDARRVITVAPRRSRFSFVFFFLFFTSFFSSRVMRRRQITPERARIRSIIDVRCDVTRWVPLG